MQRQTAALAVAAAGLGLLVLSQRRREERTATTRRQNTASKKTVKVDAVFLKRLVGLLRIVVPGVLSRETALLFSLITMLLLRTRLTIVMSHIVGSNAKSLVERDARKFVAGVLDIGLWSLPSAVVNSGIKYATSLIEARFRGNLQRYVHDHYICNSNVYKVATSGKVENPDHRVTNDVMAFANEVAQIFPMIFKPSIDVIVFIWQLSRHGGLLPPFLMIAYYMFAAGLMKVLMPNFAKLTAQTQQQEAEFHAVHSQIIQHAEEVAFYRGERTERYNADACIQSLVKHQLRVKQLKSYTDFMDAVLIKYGATCVGYAVCSIGVFALRDTANAAERTQVYIQTSQLYIPLAQAIGKLVLLHNRVTALAAFTTRVAEVRELLVSMGRSNSAVSTGDLREVPHCDKIVFDKVAIATPNGDTLLHDVDFTVERGKHMLVMGNNGSGKSSLLRVMVGIWPLTSGSITRPPLSELVFVPQRTYLPHGTMRDQLIFPDTQDDAAHKGITDERIMDMVESVGLTSVVLREGGLDGFKNWHEVLSGGERQRVAFVRVLYHRPVFAILDEATSAVSQDVEPAMYAAAQRCGATLITVSHRDSLRRFHNSLCLLDGDGHATVTPLS